MLTAASISLLIKNRPEGWGRMSVSVWTDVGFEHLSLWIPKSRYLENLNLNLTLLLDV